MYRLLQQTGLGYAVFLCVLPGMVYAATITGTVTDMLGEPISDVPVGVVAHEAGHPPDAGDFLTLPSISGSDGRFRLPGLPPGEYDVVVLGKHAPRAFGHSLPFLQARLRGVQLSSMADEVDVSVALVRNMVALSPEPYTRWTASSSVRFRWAPVPGADRYRIEVRTALHEPVLIEETSKPESSFIDISEQTGRILVWHVAAFQDQTLVALSPYPWERRWSVYVPGTEVITAQEMLLTSGARNGELTKPRSVFDVTEDRVLAWETWPDRSEEHLILARFFDPFGRLYHELPYPLSPSISRTWQGIDVSNHRAAELPGEWIVEILVDGLRAARFNFTLNE
ncbi:hypothetical protein LIP_1386 [Limnochorda pilosa]|uniref:Carboxypeptidase regulatory-like domain-containing protein n=1 Tax=Limnochorda pilosa TaxID=1555112 RepID=A0A0K2SJQ4_LIMPI|nr:hypothetical protein LIP_1386 [Limnochorda pilosa]